MPLEGQQLGHYRLVRLIGSGGMGEVYLARDTRINREVAIKVIRTEVAPYPNANGTKEAARLFQREMRAITMLDHPNILPHLLLLLRRLFSRWCKERRHPVVRLHGALQVE
jgi:eukaryotic-like serine/threonine-protein kinase